MEIIDYEKELNKLQKANRVIQKQLERSETDRINLEETNKKKEALLKNVINDLEESQNKLAQRSQELEQTLVNLQMMQNKMSVLGNLVADVAHEINNPIGFILGNIDPAGEYVHSLLHLLDLYQEFYPNPFPDIQAEIEAIEVGYLREDLPKLISAIKEGTNRICQISSSLRTFSRADTEQKIAFNLHTGIDNTLVILKHRLKGNKNRPVIEIIKDYGEIPLLECFPGQINQVFMNLLANAIDALEESNIGRSAGEIRSNPNLIKIQTRLMECENCIVIRIKDNGVGMSAETQSKIFEHLFTTKPVGQGTGLGLSIVRKIIIDKHGGSLEFDSVPGVGSEFMITLPVKEKNG
ncbi:ATP-binding protein [Cronbergia sp. UHCC 0137]|uniref:ATP-binding protein n=1 Tax=Cronbergia sp. UHCC 0137 TaxID=3110239 RepID=UPI002B2116C4|nr:ATP-binding protein [Cronbergia sp. UHCC 0137]MEA5619532.1 ATP-binding protein [Cronbergia sp. UHCC 0137]